jgi:5-methylthioadenosine/S-adenosylhomocysteine deaminase
VYAAGREHVSHVWVDGVLRMQDRRLNGVDERELRLKAAHWKEKIKS